MKICTRCKTEKSFDFFAKRSRSTDGLSSWCKSCFAEYDRLRYQNGDNERKKRNREKFREENRNKLWELLSNSQCKNCGHPDPEVLEFDHREQGAKEFNICEMLHSHSWSKIEEEIAKCDILCANCHRKRTIQQLGLWRGSRGIA